MSSAGVTLFSKEFAKSTVPPSTLGAIITAMLDFSIARTGLGVSYIELSNVSVAVTQNQSAKVILVVDVDDGSEFSKLIANELLRTFTQRYQEELERKEPSADSYAGFSSQIAEIIRSSVRPILDHLTTQRGVTQATLTMAQGTSSEILYATNDVDSISVLASLPRVMDHASELLGFKGDEHSTVSLKGERTMLTVHKIGRASLIVLTKNTVKIEQQSKKEIADSVVLLRKVLITAANLTGKGGV